LTALADVLGVLGGLLLSWVQFGIEPNFYLQTISNTVTLDDMFSGIAKTFVFGWLIAMVGCSTALATTGGTVGVGRATTRAVVTASIGVLVTDFFLTQLMVIL
jgi:phospholipid/cholesterol/gamma-HCH transport system permease protein